MKHQRGAALILVLMITFILGLLMLQMSLTAREQVARAQLLADRAEAELRAESREVALAFTLLTQPWAGPAADDNPYAAAWNFRGQPFTVDGITYRMQDVCGLLVVPLDDANGFVNLLVALGVERPRATRLGEELLALQRAPTGLPRPGEHAPPSAVDPDTAAGSRVWQGFPVQSLEELRELKDMDDALFARLEPLLTLYQTIGFNPLTAPPELLAAHLPASQLQGVLDMRTVGTLSDLSFTDLTGITPDDTTTFYPGPAFRIELTLEYRGMTVRRNTTVIVRPYVSDAFAIWSRRDLAGGSRT
jgi:type II secretory pathway component PulK